MLGRGKVQILCIARVLCLVIGGISICCKKNVLSPWYCLWARRLGFDIMIRSYRANHGLFIPMKVLAVYAGYKQAYLYSIGFQPDRVAVVALYCLWR